MHSLGAPFRFTEENDTPAKLRGEEKQRSGKEFTTTI